MSHSDLAELLPSQNIGSTERLLTAIAGGVLMASALRRGHLLMGVAGGILAARGVSGYCPAYGLWQHYTEGSKHFPKLGKDGGSAVDEVTLAAEHSFPASDPPSFNAGRA